eukprot:4918975-Pleurochrysis_carterae.AAC.1
MVPRLCPWRLTIPIRMTHAPTTRGGVSTSRRNLRAHPQQLCKSCKDQRSHMPVDGAHQCAPLCPCGRV